MKQISGLLAFVAFAAAFLSPAWGEEQKAARAFHPPQTEAEKMLDEIFQQRKSDAGMNYFILKRPGYEARNKKEYARFFTEDLLDAWAKAGKKDVDEGCGGVYRGEICALDFDPLTCSQDVPEVYLYRTMEARANEVVLTYAWPEDMRDGARYRMVKSGDGWMLDGVDCGENYRFNAR